MSKKKKTKGKKTTKKTAVEKKTLSEVPKVVVNPVCCIYHDAEKYIVEGELPGVKKKNIDIEATEHSFCLRGKKEDVLYSACYHMAHEINLNKAEAEFMDGMLKIVLPFRRPIKTSKIKIK